MDCTASSIELYEASNVLLMTLMEEENQEDHYYYQNFEDERLVSMISDVLGIIDRFLPKVPRVISLPFLP